MFFMQFHTNWIHKIRVTLIHFPQKKKYINPYFIIQCFITIIKLFSPQVYYEECLSTTLEMISCVTFMVCADW